MFNHCCSSLVIILVGMLLTESISAASISTRVKVMESKIVKQEKMIKQIQNNHINIESRFLDQQNRLHKLENKIDKTINDPVKKSDENQPPYAFP
jgi:peptidoglycan hydrolase CwlO-like protein